MCSTRRLIKSNTQVPNCQSREAGLISEYIRLNPRLKLSDIENGRPSMDNASDENIDRLLADAQTFIDSQPEIIKKIIKLLTFESDH